MKKSKSEHLFEYLEERFEDVTYFEENGGYENGGYETDITVYGIDKNYSLRIDYDCDGNIVCTIECKRDGGWNYSSYVFKDVGSLLKKLKSDADNWTE